MLPRSANPQFMWARALLWMDERKARTRPLPTPIPYTFVLEGLLLNNTNLSRSHSSIIRLQIRKPSHWRDKDFVQVHMVRQAEPRLSLCHGSGHRKQAASNWGESAQSCPKRWSLSELSRITRVSPPGLVVHGPPPLPARKPDPLSLHNGSVFSGFQIHLPRSRWKCLSWQSLVSPESQRKDFSLSWMPSSSVKHTASKTHSSLSRGRWHGCSLKLDRFLPFLLWVSVLFICLRRTPLADIVSTCSSHFLNDPAVLLLSPSHPIPGYIFLALLVDCTKAGFPDAHVYTEVLVRVVLIIKDEFSLW